MAAYPCPIGCAIDCDRIQQPDLVMVAESSGCDKETETIRSSEISHSCHRWLSQEGRYWIGPSQVLDVIDFLARQSNTMNSIRRYQSDRKARAKHRPVGSRCNGAPRGASGCCRCCSLRGGGGFFLCEFLVYDPLNEKSWTNQRTQTRFGTTWGNGASGAIECRAE